MAMFHCGGGNDTGEVKVVTETFTSSSSRYITFPTGRIVINAKTGDNILFIKQYSTYCSTRNFLNTASADTINWLEANTDYSVTYSYIELNS